jgi:hypothetical protein
VSICCLDTRHSSICNTSIVPLLTEFVQSCVEVYKIDYINAGWRAVAQLVEARRYAPEGRGFDSRLNPCHTQPVTEVFYNAFISNQKEDIL